jgi:hypothetical protein
MAQSGAPDPWCSSIPREACGMLQERHEPLTEADMNLLHRPHLALKSAISLTGIVAIECALVAGVLLALHIDPM